MKVTPKRNTITIQQEIRDPRQQDQTSSLWEMQANQSWRAGKQKYIQWKKSGRCENCHR